MTIRDFPITFPLRGLSENVSYDGQPPSTTRSGKNVRSMDCRTGRVRGAQRPGTSKWIDAVVSGAGNPVIDLNQLVTDDRQLTYSVSATGGLPPNIETVWEVAVPGPASTSLYGTGLGNPIFDAETGSDGNVYCVGLNNAFFILSPSGAILQNVSVPVISGDLRRITVDDLLNVYVSIAAGGTQADARVWKYKPNLSTGIYELDWTLSLVKATSTGAGTTVCYGTFLHARGGDLYVAVQDETASEGEVHVYTGISASAAPASASVSFGLLNQPGGYDEHPRCLAVNEQGDIFVTWHENVGAGTDNQGISKFNANGDLLAGVSTKDVSGIGSGTGTGGMGMAIALTADGNFYTMGEKFSGGDAAYVRYWSDIGTTTPTTGNDFTAIWANTDSSSAFILLNVEHYLRIAVDSSDNVYVPWPTYVSPGEIRVLDTGGNELALITTGDTSEALATTCIVLSNVRPDYGDDAVLVDEFLYAFGVYKSYDISGLGPSAHTAIASSTNTSPIVVTLSLANQFVEGDDVFVDAHLVNTAANGRWKVGTVTSTTVFELAGSHGNGIGINTGDAYPLAAGFKARLLDVTVTSGSHRTHKTFAVANGNIMEGDAGAGTWTAVSGGAAALDSTGEFIQSTSLFGNMFWVDGKVAKTYSDKTDVVTDFIATAGEVPERCKLISTYRGRLVMARPADDGSDWFMSKIGDPFNWDFGNAIVTQSVRSAVVGSSSDAGKVQDIINGLIPWNDDLFFFMGDHTIWRLTGDPLSASGEIDNVSQTIGMAFGASWARDPNGILYFFSTEGGVYRMPPTGLPERISVQWIERRLSDVDLTARNARLQWDYRREGLQIFLTARTGTSTAAQEHYFWEQKTGSWWPEDRAATAGSAPTRPHEPRSVMSLDGDSPDDRRFLIGCEDGYVRFVDEDQRDDDGTAINSTVLLGPFTAKGFERQIRMISMRVTLASNEGGCNWKLYATDEAGVLGPVRSQGRFEPGRSPQILGARIQAEYFYIELQDFTVSQHWAFESGNMRLARAGRRR